MHITLIQALSAGLGGGTLWMVYSAIWRHAPAKFPRTIDDWWGWIRGANQEIAAQHGAGGEPPVNP